MSQDTTAADLTRLLLVSRAHFTRLTLEELPVGCVTVSREGVITNVDSFTRQFFGLSEQTNSRNSITLLFEDPAFDVIERLRLAQYGYVGKIRLRTRSDIRAAQVALLPGLEAHRFTFTLVYTSSDEIETAGSSTLTASGEAAGLGTSSERRLSIPKGKKQRVPRKEKKRNRRKK